LLERLEPAHPPTGHDAREQGSLALWDLNRAPRHASKETEVPPMTTIPDIDRQTVNLICDNCGHTRSVPDILCDPEVVWPLLAASGWNGSPFATGRHWCPNCDRGVAQPAFTSEHQTTGREPRPCQISLRPLRNATLVTVGGDVRGTAINEIQEVLTAAVATGTHILVDLSEAVLESASLGILVRAHGDLKQKGSTLCCVAPSKFVTIELHTMRLDRAIATFEDEKSALSWLNSPDSARTRTHGRDVSRTSPGGDQ
jgi:anti-sigma B factor antagonist